MYIIMGESVIKFDLLTHSLTLTWSPEGGQPLDLSTASYQPSV